MLFCATLSTASQDHSETQCIFKGPRIIRSYGYVSSMKTRFFTFSTYISNGYTFFACHYTTRCINVYRDENYRESIDEKKKVL